MRPPFTAAIAISAKDQALRDSREYYGPMVDLDDEEEPAWWEKVVRYDSLPEGSTYTDTGCELAPSCLSCPFPRCRYDGGSPLRSQAAEHLYRFRQLREAGLSVDAAAREMGVSRRQAFRYRAMDND